VRDNLRREPVIVADLDRQLRGQGIFDVRRIELGILETTGRLSVRTLDQADQPMHSSLPPAVMEVLGGHERGRDAGRAA
jgi:uncharacterized membrane protein YcaP (DUF421 family)